MTNHTTITKPAGGDALLQLITRYRCELDAFNAHHFEDDDECIAAANSTFESTLSNMVGMPAETKAEALAALQLLQHEFLCSPNKSKLPEVENREPGPGIIPSREEARAKRAKRRLEDKLGQ